MKNKHNYKFPSAILNEIEKPLRRGFRKGKKTDIKFIIINGILFGLILTMLYFFVARVVDDQAHAAEVSREYSYSILCEQYKADSSLTGTAAEETLSTICK